MNLRDVKDHMVGCYSISAKNKNNIDITFKWLNNLKRRRQWFIYFSIFYIINFINKKLN